MENNASQFNKRQPQKKVSEIGRVDRNRSRHRVSLAKSVGKLRKGEQETPIVAIQQVHLLRKQKAFLNKQAFVFEKKVQTVREQVKALELKIKSQKELVSKLVDGLDEDPENVVTLSKEPNSKPDITIKQKPKKIFKMKY